MPDPRKFKYTGDLEAAQVGHQVVRKGETVEVDDQDLAVDMAEAEDWELVEGSKPRRSKAAKDVETAEVQPPPSPGG